MPAKERMPVNTGLASFVGVRETANGKHSSPAFLKTFRYDASLNTLLTMGRCLSVLRMVHIAVRMAVILGSGPTFL